MAKRKSPEMSENAATDTMQESPDGMFVECKRGHPIKNPHGDNGCGYHTVAEKPVTNCVPVE